MLASTRHAVKDQKNVRVTEDEHDNGDSDDWEDVEEEEEDKGEGNKWKRQKTEAAADGQERPIDKLRKVMKQEEEATGLKCVVLEGWEPDSDEDEDAEPTYEQLLALPRVMLHPATIKKLEDVSTEVGRIGDMGNGMSMTNTSSSLEAFEIFEHHLDQANRKSNKKSNNISAAFNIALALTLTFKSNDFWYLDHEDPEEVQSLIDRLKRLWTKLWKHTDTELGLGRAQDRETIKKVMAKFHKNVKEANES
eukprot:comp28572_c0_seq1/m.47204 comp28572_c0_seq1/g.47204  ORF comp28572_c0_seq1/g.47204 comp28572_c0_seq1/m.47204 type:complete len:250 (-) comp28572_c0_seq1:35-784(-)